MRSDHGNLRHRTRDSSWQWLLMGTILGIGFALVICVGGYALNVITFPVLSNEDSTPQVEIAVNQAEIDLQMLAAQQTLDAVQQTPDSPVVANAGEEATQLTPQITSSAELTLPPSPAPSPLPNNTEAGTNPDQPAAPVTDDAVTATTPNPTPPSGATQQVALPQGESPIVVTPAVEVSSSDTLTEPSMIPPELDAIKTDIVPIIGGTYMMGTTLEEASKAMDECAIYDRVCDDLSVVSDSTPLHQVTVDSFQMEVYEVSLSQYAAFLNWLGPNSHMNQCQGRPCVFTTVEEPERSYIAFDGTLYSVRNSDFSSNHPVTLVTWWGAEAYCRALNRRLPTEAEWERAARGSQNFIYPWGNEFDVQKALSSVPEAAGIMAVESFPAGISSYSVLNMAGNVSEWVSDWYQDNFYSLQLNNPEPNPLGPASGIQKVHRGGSWDTIPLFLRSVHRMANSPDNPSASIGFRCVVSSASAVPPTAPTANDTQTDTNIGGAPILPAQPTLVPQPTWTSSVPTETLAPG